MSNSSSWLKEINSIQILFHPKHMQNQIKNITIINLSQTHPNWNHPANQLKMQTDSMLSEIAYRLRTQISTRTNKTIVPARH